MQHACRGIKFGRPKPYPNNPGFYAIVGAVFKSGSSCAVFQIVDITQLVYDFGPSIGVILFFIGRDVAREERMSKQIEGLNRFIQNELIEMVKHDK